MNKKITRKEAIKKVGLTGLAASSLLLLNTQAKAQCSGGGNPGNDNCNGKSGENPNGKSDWGSTGSRGQGDKD